MDKTITFDRAHKISMARELTGTKRQSYTVSDKLRIINFVEQHGNRAPEREFGVSKSNVRLWRKSKENLEKMPRLKRANSGKQAAWPGLETDLLGWITEKRNNGLAILPLLVRLKALEMARDEKYGIPAGHLLPSGEQRIFVKQMSFVLFSFCLCIHFSLLIFQPFFFPKRSQKLGCVLYTGVHYTRVNVVIQHVWLLSQSQKDFCGYYFKEAKPLSYQAVSPSRTSHCS